MLKSISVSILMLLFCSAIFAQSNQAPDTAANPVQESPGTTAPAVEPQFLEVKIPAGTALDIQATHSVSSMDAKLGDLISFRVLVPVKVGESIVIGST